MEDYHRYLSELYRPSLEKSNREDFICLDKNEPPFSAFGANSKLFLNQDLENLRIYPDPYILYFKLAKFENIDINKLLITFGSEQAIRFVFEAFLDYGDEVLITNPYFAMLDVFAYYKKCNLKYVDYDVNRKLTTSLILKKISDNTKLFVLANPNNLTGHAFNLPEIEKIAKHTQNTKTIFLLDEAYYHYYNIDSIKLIENYNNIIITRTFSKAWGLAGLRVGYAISNYNNINILRKLKPIDEISFLSMKICLNAIDNSADIIKKNVEQVYKWKKIFQQKSFIDLEYLNTLGNYILLKSKNYIFHKNIFLANKFLPKMDFTHESVKGCFRFSIGDDKTMNRLLGLIT